MRKGRCPLNPAPPGALAGALHPNGPSHHLPSRDFGQIQFWSHLRLHRHRQRLPSGQTTNFARCALHSSQQ